MAILASGMGDVNLAKDNFGDGRGALQKIYGKRAT
jgi:hypothetical protein